jgi:hypothetical protein
MRRMIKRRRKTPPMAMPIIAPFDERTWMRIFRYEKRIVVPYMLRGVTA